MDTKAVKHKPGNRRISTLNPSLLFIESYKILRSNLLSSLVAETSGNIIMVTSPNAGEGKTTVCANLAIATAQTRSEVLIIDADMRRPAQHKVFNIPNDKGLSSLLRGVAKTNNCIRKIYPCLHLLPAGPAPPNPSELLASDQIDRLLTQLGETFKYIFLDTTSIDNVADSLVLAGKPVGTLLISRYGKTTYDGISTALEKLEHSGAKLLGLVVNGKGRRKNNTRYSLLSDYEKIK